MKVILIGIQSNLLFTINFMTKRSDFFRQQKQMENFRLIISCFCLALISFSSLTLGFAISEYLDEMARLSDQAGQTAIFTAKQAATPNFEIIDVSTGVIRQASAYNSVPEQTDDTPCISADGSNICELLAAGECIIAGNFADLGSQHYIDGIGLCTLHDRMSSRYQENIDIFFGYDIQAAKNFGRQNLLVKSI